MRKRIMPVRQAQVHDHKSEVVRERVSNEKPAAGEVLEPYLRLGCWRLEDESEASVFYLLIDIECTDSHFFAAKIEKVKRLEVNELFLFR